MDITEFFVLLSGFSMISGLLTEGIKKMAADRANLPYNITALSCSLFTGGFGMAAYYRQNAIPFTPDNSLYILLMGLAAGLVSMVGFDKVKQAVQQLRF